MDRPYQALLLTIAFVSITGCASMRNTNEQTPEQRKTEFQNSVSDYKRLQRENSESEYKSEGEKVQEEKRGEPTASSR